MQASVLIIGGGLSGLHTAYECQKRNLDYLLVEARDRLGGRILSKNQYEYNPDQVAFDLGPSWFWPGQSAMQSLLSELELSDQIVQQYGEGDALFEDNQGNIRRGIDGISMAGAYRLRSGMGQLIYRLQQKLPSDRYFCKAVVKHLQYKNQEVTTTVDLNGKNIQVASRYVVLALPPRVAMNSMAFEPAFTETRVSELNNIATWMAGHAKLCAVYDQPFWKEQGYSGDAVSHSGPLQEIHDASSDDAQLNALFGFVSIQAQHRIDKQDQIKALALTQLARLFGKEATNPRSVVMKDWALDTYTATSKDQEIQRFHPSNDIINVTELSWQQQLIWSGSESAAVHLGNNGFLEGALEASLRTMRLLDQAINAS